MNTKWKWSEDEKLISYVSTAVSSHLRRLGFHHKSQPTLEWIVEQIADMFDWDDPEVKQDNVRDIATNAEKRALRLGYKPGKAPPAKVMMPTGSGVVILTAMKIRSEVQEVRLWLYGKKTPLFPHTRDGHTSS